MYRGTNSEEHGYWDHGPGAGSYVRGAGFGAGACRDYRDDGPMYGRNESHEHGYRGDYHGTGFNHSGAGFDAGTGRDIRDVCFVYPATQFDVYRCCEDDRYWLQWRRFWRRHRPRLP